MTKGFSPESVSPIVASEPSVAPLAAQASDGDIER